MHFSLYQQWVKSIGVLPDVFLQCEELKGKIYKFFGDFPVPYVALFINMTINNNYMTLLMALNHTHGGF